MGKTGSCCMAPPHHHHTTQVAPPIPHYSGPAHDLSGGPLAGGHVSDFQRGGLLTCVGGGPNAAPSFTMTLQLEA